MYRLIKRFCEICTLGFMDSHPQRPDIYTKCRTCGFTKTIKLENEMITLDDYWMGRDKRYPSEFTDELENNAKQLLDKVNNLLTELGIVKTIVSSGWRPLAINSQIKNAAKKSLHTKGQAVDIKDDDGSLKKLIRSKSELLKKYGLWMEHEDSTPGWCHLDCGNRTDRDVRIFRP